MKVYGVIMAGGGGTRFWPLSRNKKPKQLLNLSGKDVMINETIDRLSNIIDKENLFIITNHEQVELTKELVGDRICEKNILSEPCARNTSACIGYAAIEIIKKYGDGIMVVIPSDAYIKDVKSYCNIISEAINVAKNTQRLVTIGITPTFPSTGYGYIKFDKSQNGVGKVVEEFKEKPDLQTAKRYVDSGYVWNAGIFVWKVSVILEKFKEFLPDTYSKLIKMSDAMNTDIEYQVINQIYPTIDKISIDYGIIEKASDIMVVLGEFGWSDVGSWDMLDVLNNIDENKNVIIGDVLPINTKNSTIYSSKKFIATVGLDNLIVVETEDAILVCSKDDVQDVKLVVEQLKEQGKHSML